MKFALILLRQSPDWESLRSVDPLHPELFDVKVGLAPGTSRRAIQLWDSTMPISFFSLRSKLKKLSLENYRQAHHSSLDVSQSRFRLSRFRLVHFTDDDDLIAPHWLSNIPSADLHLVFCRWTSVRYDGSFDFRANSSQYSFTNNYAVYPLARRQFTFSQVYQHFDQSANHNRLAPHQVRYIDLPLSVTHKHPASINTLRKCLQAADWDPCALRVMVGAYVERARSTKLPDSLAWMSTWRSQAAALFEGLIS